jgi:hypothetical protein
MGLFGGRTPIADFAATLAEQEVQDAETAHIDRLRAVAGVGKITMLERFAEVEPPILRERYVATRVEFHPAVPGRDDSCKVFLDRDVNLESRDEAFGADRVEVHLQTGYACKFHAGQKFWLTINPAARDE